MLHSFRRQLVDTDSMGHLIRGVTPSETGTDAGTDPRDKFTWEIYRDAKPDLVPRGHWYFAFSSGDAHQERHVTFKTVMAPGFKPMSRQTITLPFHGRSHVENTWPVGPPGTTGFEMTPYYIGRVLFIRLGEHYIPRPRRIGGDVSFNFSPFNAGDALFIAWTEHEPRWPPNYA